MSEKHPLPITSPEAVGIPSDAVVRFFRKLAAKRLPMHSVLMLRHGQIAVEGYYKPFDLNRKHRMHSTSKSFVSVAVGILIGEGKLKLSDRVAQFFPDKASSSLHPFLAQATIRDLLMMATPHTECAYYKGPDWADAFFATPPTHLPGKIFSYDTTATVMLCIVIYRITGVEFIEYLRPRLFAPLGMNEDIECIKTACGHDWGGSGVLCTPRDLAKFALVCMNDGRFDGAQLIPEDYIRAATSRQIDNALTADEVELSFGYGYQFWRTRNNGFACLGMGSQIAVCLPEQDFVLVTTADTQAIPSGFSLIYEALWTELYPHLQKGDKLPANAAACAGLQDMLGRLSVLTVEGASVSPTAASVSGKTYTLADNAMGIKILRFAFGDGEGSLDYENATGAHSLRFGFGRQIAQAFPETHYNGRRIGIPYGRGYECLCSAAWAMPESLLVYCYAIDDHVGTLKMQFVFKDNSVTVLMGKHAEWFFGEYVGFASGACEE